MTEIGRREGITSEDECFPPEIPPCVRKTDWGLHYLLNSLLVRTSVVDVCLGHP